MQTRDDEANLDTHPTPDQGVLFLKTKCSTLGWTQPYRGHLRADPQKGTFTSSWPPRLQNGRSRIARAL